MNRIKNLYNNGLSLLGAKTGIGKTDLAINLILELALKNNKSILLLGFDGPSAYYTKMFIAIMLNTNFQNIEKYLEPIRGNRNHNITKVDKDSYFKALETLYKSGIYMYNKNIIPCSIEEYIKYVIKDTKIDLVIIDNLEIINREYNYKNEADTENLIQNLEQLSSEENIPILILTSLDYKKEFIKLNLLDNFKYSKNLLRYFHTITLLDMDYITRKKNVYKDLYIFKDNKVNKLNIKHNRETRKMQVVDREIEN